MKKIGWLFILTTVFVLALAGCKSKKKGIAGEDAPPFNPYVEAFTSGKVSRKAPVYLVFNKDIPADKLNEADIAKNIKIKPAVAGNFSVENSNTIVFRPTEEFKRDESYEVKVDLSKWFNDAKGEETGFKFAFSTQPFVIRGNLESLDENADNANGYDIRTEFLTIDSEDAATVESLVAVSENVQKVWHHSPDGRSHHLTLQNVEAKDKARVLTLKAASNKLGVSTKENLLAVNVPAAGEFSVYSVEYVTMPEKRIEVTFTKKLNPKQNLRGLAYIEKNSSEMVRMEGNKLFLYPDADRTGETTVFINHSVANAAGVQLAEDAVFKLDLGDRYPRVNFIGEGVIIPQTDRLSVPFQAANLRGVQVKVMRINERNIGQFLQVNRLDGSDELMRVGRVVALKTIFLDENPDNDLTKLSTYSIDLNQLMQPEPGAIYRIFLTMSKQLSAYPCSDEENEGQRRLSRAEIEAQDQIQFLAESQRFDNGGYYYYSDYYGYDYDYDYSERNNPCHSYYYYYHDKSAVRNVMATNIGLIAMAGEGGGYTVLARNIIDTKPMKDVQIKLFSYQNTPMGEGVTDEKGQVDIVVKSGKPFYIVASQGAQRAYLRVDAGSALSLSTFDISGEVIQKGVKGFIYGERGVWRPGDPMYLSFMLNDRAGNLPPDHPVVMELYNPLGQLFQSKTRTKGELGLYTFEFVTDPESPTGAWNAVVKVGGVKFEKRLRVEAIKPNRLKIDIKLDDKVLTRGVASDAKMHVEWLQGAVARNLKYEIEGTMAVMKTAFDNYKNYVFDDPSKRFESEEVGMISGHVNDEGNAVVPLKFNIGSTAPGMLMAGLVTRVFEESGDFSMDAFTVKYSPYRRYAGIESPQKTQEQLNTGKSYGYKVVSVDPEGKPVGGTTLRVNIYKVDWYWWWSSDNSRLARYMADDDYTSVRDLSLTTAGDGTAKFDLSFTNEQWGTYYIRVYDPVSGHSTGVMSYFDWPYGNRREEGRGGATTLSFTTDKPTYKPGEKLSVTIPSAAGSRAVVAIQNGSKVITVKDFECHDKQTTIKMDVTAEMQPNAYVYVTLLQPHAQTKNDLPIRLYGVVPFTVSSDDSKLTPVIAVADELRPESQYEVTVSEKSGKEMAYTLAIVDEGLLDLTRFRTPNPWSAFNAREALGVSTWDLYNYVIGAYGGRIEQLFSIGGDDALDSGPKAIVNRFKPVVQFEGPFLLKKGAKMRHKYDMPNYNGRVRVMVVAGNGKAYGSADKSVMVRKPVMVIGTLPRVIGVNEEMAVPATVFVTQDNMGPVKVNITCSDNMEIVGGAEQTLDFKTTGDKQATFRIRVKGRLGAGKVTITAVGKGEKSVYETDIQIRSVRIPQTKVQAVTLKAGETWNQTITMPGAAGTNKLTLEMANVEPLNLTSRLDFLLGYPHGCIEQITSKGFPQIFLKQLADLTKEQATLAEEAVKDVIRRHRSYQTSDGGMSYWPGGSDSHSWASVYAAHFETEAEARGFAVPEQMKKALLANIAAKAKAWSPSSGYYGRSEELTQAYRLYVLALAKAPELGAMNRMKEDKNLAPMARWMLALAYAKAGRKDVAKSLTEQTVSFSDDMYNEYDLTFGSPLRDRSIMLQVLAALDQGGEAAVQAREISKTFASDAWLSTQESAFGLLAMSEYMNAFKTDGELEFSYVCGNQKEKVSTKKNIWRKELIENGGETAALELKNTSKAPIFVRIITEGIPDQGTEPAYASGLGLIVSYFDQSGAEINVTDLKQGVNFTAVVTVRNPTTTTYKNVALTQVFPSGWEILNTRFVNEEVAGKLPQGINYQDIRDDRVYTYFDRFPAGRQITVRINLCSVYSGSFYLPPVSVEAMYDNTVRANTEGMYVKVQ